MGWTAFSVKRSKNGADLGEMAIIVPKMSIQYPLKDEYSISDLLELKDYPIEANLFCFNSKDATFLKSIGFGNAVDLTPYVGERWTLNNGNYFEVMHYYADNKELHYYLSNGTRVQLGQFSTRADNGTNLVASYAIGLYGEGQECGISFLWVTTGTIKGQIKFSRDLFPDQIGDLQFYKDAKPIYIANDPYDGGGESTHGGGGGKFDDSSTPTDIPVLPSVGASETGFITLYNPTKYNLKDLATYLWSGPFEDATFKKLFANPMDALLGLSILPVKPGVSAPQAMKFGNAETPIVAPVVTSQYVAVDCGTLFLDEYWGAYLDYSPYTKIDIYLPYIGIHPLSADDVVNKTIHVVYHVDVLSGACVAFIQCDDSVIYSFAGQCSTQIPINGDNWNNVFNGAISVATSIGTMIASGGMTAPMGVAQIASTAVNSSKPAVEKSGSVSGACGMLSIQTPYLIITRPRQATPKFQNTYMGYPSFITENLADLNGYTEIESIHLENVPATAQELSEIESLLKSGVIF